MLLGSGPFGRKKFSACLNNFDMGEMGSGARIFKFFWRRHNTWMGVFYKRRFFCYWQRYPLAVWMLLGRCLRTRAAVNPGHLA